ncbi:MAG: DUF2336 domain-containing protein [Sneathiella sp.]|nr:DUF2336 domain-containing protein [Sneathiella sp.]
MVESTEVEMSDLMALSKDSSKAARRRLFENMSGLFLTEEDRFNEQERAHISDIMTKLLVDVELSVRATLAKNLSTSDQAPAELISLLANDDILVARPILAQSRVLMEKDLLSVIELRSKEHLLAITEREDISPIISDLLIEYGDDDVIEHLIQNKDAEISKEALALLVEETKRVDRFQEPLLARHDLPTELAHKMFWWVSAALRRHIIQSFDIDANFLDLQIANSTRENIEDQSIPAFGESHADRLAAHLAAKNELTERTLIQSLKSRQIRLFVAGMSIKTGLDGATLSRFVHDKNAEAMAVVCKSLEFDRNSFSAVFLLTRRGGAVSGTSKVALNPSEIESVMKFYDKLSSGNAKAVVQHWKLDSGYLEAIEQIDDQTNEQRVYL